MGRAVAQGWTLGTSSHVEYGLKYGGLQDMERGPEKYEKFLLLSCIANKWAVAEASFIHPRNIY